MQIPRSYGLVMCAGMVLALIICKIFLSGVPFNIVGILRNFITHPKISHFHRSRPLAFDSVVCDAPGYKVHAYVTEELFYDKKTAVRATYF